VLENPAPKGAGFFMSSGLSRSLVHKYLDKLCEGPMLKKILIGIGAVSLVLAFTVLMGIATPWIDKEIQIYHAKQNLNIQQSILSNVENTDIFINDKIRTLMNKVPVDGIHVSMMHLSPSETPNTTPTQIVIDSTNAIRRSGKVLSLADNLPVSEWRDYLPEMNKHRCAFVLTKNLTDPEAKTRVSTFAYATLACPIFSADNSHLIGGLFLTWDVARDVPTCLSLSCKTPESMIGIATIAKSTASEIGQYMSKDLKE
jgi:hypothetical protein